jgi:hypothetical protein
MGLFERFKRIPDPVDGTAQVVSATGAPDGHGSAACGLDLVVTVPGVPAFPVRGTHLVKMAKWPWPGQVLPITASRADPSRFKILWDRVPTGRDRAAEQAARLADAFNAGAAPPPRPTQVFVNGRPATPGEAQRVAGVFSGRDRLERLERLAALHRSGAITATEYERLKREILGG